MPSAPAIRGSSPLIRSVGSGMVAEVQPGGSVSGAGFNWRSVAARGALVRREVVRTGGHRGSFGVTALLHQVPTSQVPYLGSRALGRLRTGPLIGRPRLACCRSTVLLTDACTPPSPHSSATALPTAQRPHPARTPASGTCPPRPPRRRSGSAARWRRPARARSARTRGRSWPRSASRRG